MESLEGKGSTFRFDVSFTPVKEVIPLRAENGTETHVFRNANQYRILIVEDNDDNKNLLRSGTAAQGLMDFWSGSLM